MRIYARLDDYDDYDDYDSENNRRFRKERSKPKKTHSQVIAELAAPEVGLEGEFNPSFQPGENERVWIITYLQPFYDDQIISDVIKRVKGGKEANVYCCPAHPTTNVDLLAAKLYRPREHRNLRNDAQYRQGRQVLNGEGKLVKNERELHAIAKGSSYGKELSHTSWLAHEYQTLQLLHAAGADVPKPWAVAENAIIMEYFGDEYRPAPTLHDTRLDRREARVALDRVIHNIDLMLQHGRVHGDLSAYNILYWEGDLRLIDFPQAVDIHTNNDAWLIFLRDIERVCQYFAKYGIAPEAHRLATKLWRRYMAEDNFEALNLLATDGFLP